MLTKDQVQHIAQLARIGLTEKEVERFQKELSAILDFFEELKKAKTTEVKPMAQPGQLKNAFRQDEPRLISEEERKKLLNLAPAQEKNYFKVKAVL